MMYPRVHRGLEVPCEDIGGDVLLGCVAYVSLVLWITQRTDWLHFDCQSECVVFYVVVEELKS